MTSSTCDVAQAAPSGAAPRVTGLDPSLTSFGCAVCLPGQEPALLRWRTKKRGHDRLEWLLDHVIHHVSFADFVVIEGLAHGARSSSMLDLAGLHWLVRHRLWEMGKPYAVVAPSTRAKWLTGKGNSSKDECLAAAIKRFTMADISGNDDADALTLAAMGLAIKGSPLVTMPADREAQLEKAEICLPGQLFDEEG